MKKVSVIIPVTREKLAQKAINSVKRQNYPGLQIIKIKAKGLNPAQARNKGAKRAKGEILLFLDDDCQAEKNWLEENLKALADKRIGAVGGMIRGKSKKYFSRCLDFANFTFTQKEKRCFMPVCSASLGIRRSVFKKVGGFDKNLMIGEDLDLCWRLKKMGWQTVYEPKVKVWHDHKRTSLGEVLKYQYKNGRIKGLLIEKRYADNNFWFKFLKIVGKPWLYWVFILPFALLATAIAVVVNLKQKIFLLIPGIFLAKLACQWGIFVWVLGQNNRESI